MTNSISSIPYDKLEMIKNLSLIELIKNKFDNTELIDSNPQLQKVIMGMEYIMETSGYETANAVWTLSKPHLPKELLELKYKITIIKVIA